VLKQLDGLLDDDELYRQVRADLGKRYKGTLFHGRHSTPVEVIARMLLCKHLYQWSFKETEERVRDSLVLRWFCRVYFERVPDETTLICWLHTLCPQTLHTLNDRVVQLAKQAKVTSGRKLRLDASLQCKPRSTIEADSGLLVESVRVLSRIVQHAKPLLAEPVRLLKQLCRSRLPTARRTAQTLHRQVRRKGEDKEAEQKELYQKLVETTEEMVKQTKAVVSKLATGSKETVEAAETLLSQACQFLPLVEQVIAQTRTRVLEGKKVASQEKVLSLFEPHTRAIPRHKGGALVSIGRQVILYAGGGRHPHPL
jgi:IS5 family transposase